MSGHEWTNDSPEAGDLESSMTPAGPVEPPSDAAAEVKPRSRFHGVTGNFAHSVAKFRGRKKADPATSPEPDPPQTTDSPRAGRFVRLTQFDWSKLPLANARRETRVGMAVLLSFVVIVSVMVLNRHAGTSKTPPSLALNTPVANGSKDEKSETPKSPDPASLVKKKSRRDKQAPDPPSNADVSAPTELTTRYPNEGIQLASIDTPPAPTELMPPKGDPAAPPVATEPKPEPTLPPPGGIEPAKPVEPLPSPAEPSKGGMPEPKPAEPLPKPAEPKPAEPLPKPAEPKPAEPTPAPKIEKPVEPKPAEPTPAPKIEKPAEPLPLVEPKPVEPTTPPKIEPKVVEPKSAPEMKAPDTKPIKPPEPETKPLEVVTPPIEPTPPAVTPTPIPAVTPSPAEPVPIVSDRMPMLAKPPTTVEPDPVAAPSPSPTLSPGAVPIRNLGKQRPTEPEVESRPGAAPPVADAPMPREVVGASDRVDPVLHTVKSGENFWTISKYYYDSGRFYKALHSANRKLVPNIRELYVGTTIKVPPLEDLDPTLIDAPARASTGTVRTSRPTDDARPASGKVSVNASRSRERLSDVEEPSQPTYKVRQHDTLRGIARDTLGDSRRYREILEINRDVIDDPAHLTVGQSLTLPEDATVGRRLR